MTAGYWIKPCYGYSAAKGGKVGERHRWSGEAWGKGSCIWCHRDLEQLRYKAEAPVQPGSEMHLAQALRSAA